MGMPPEEIAAVVAAVSNHDEGEGEPVSDISTTRHGSRQGWQL